MTGLRTASPKWRGELVNTPDRLEVFVPPTLRLHSMSAAGTLPFNHSDRVLPIHTLGMVFPINWNMTGALCEVTNWSVTGGSDG